MNIFFQTTTLVIALAAIISPIFTTYLQNRNKVRINLINNEINNLSEQIENKQQAIKELSSAYGNIVSGKIINDKDRAALYQKLMECSPYVNSALRKEILSFKGISPDDQQKLQDQFVEIMDNLVDSINCDQKRLGSLVDELMPANFLRKGPNKKAHK